MYSEGAISTAGTTAEWSPAHVIPVAGALIHPLYTPFVRFMIRLTARLPGASIDISRNTEYADWRALDQFMEEWNAKFGGKPTVTIS